LSSLAFAARCLLPLSLCLGLPSCSADDTPIDYVGVVTPSGKDTPVRAPYVAGQATCSSTATMPPTVPPVVTSPCALTTPGGSGLPGLALRGGHILVGLGDRVAAFDASAQGCPSAPTTDEASALAAGPLAAGDLLWAATSDAVLGVGASGEAPASCAVPHATGLAALAAGGAVAIDGGARFYPLSVTSSDEGPACASDPVALPAGELVTAVGPALTDGSVWLATLRDDCGPVAFVGRRDLATGELTADSPVIEGRQAGLCRVSGLLELADRLVILDGGCPQIVTVDATTGTILGRTTLAASQAPLALAPLSPGGALVLISSPALGGTTLSFLRLP
jgi:hypothetical protein